MHIAKQKNKGGGGEDYTYVQLYDTLYIHMQKEINKLLTSEIATKVREEKTLNMIYHCASENLLANRIEPPNLP